MKCKLIATITLTVALLFASANTNATNITNVFPQLGTTYTLCQRIGFDNVTSAADQAAMNFTFIKEQYRFLPNIPASGTCYLKFNQSSKTLRRIYYIYNAKTPTLEPGFASLVEEYSTHFGKCSLKTKYREQFFTWKHEQYTITMNLDDIHNTMSISVSWQ